MIQKKREDINENTAHNFVSDVDNRNVSDDGTMNTVPKSMPSSIQKPFGKRKKTSDLSFSKRKKNT